MSRAKQEGDVTEGEKAVSSSQKLELLAVEMLLHAVGKVAVREGEAWRLDHPELMDAYQALQELYKEFLKMKLQS